MKKIYILLITISLTACAELATIVENYPINIPLTEEEVANGLKEALRVGTDSASAHLGITNGYYGDELGMSNIEFNSKLYKKLCACYSGSTFAIKHDFKLIYFLLLSDEMWAETYSLRSLYFLITTTTTQDFTTTLSVCLDL